MKRLYREGIIIFQGERYPMDDIRKEYIRQFPGKVGKHLVKHESRKTYIDWRELFYQPNIYIILWNLMTERRLKMERSLE